MGREAMNSWGFGFVELATPEVGTSQYRCSPCAKKV